MIKEFCAENYSNLPHLTSHDIQRVELCDNLAVGGTTPSYGVIKKSVELLHQKGIQVATMIRPRGGDYTYTSDEVEIMCQDIIYANQLNSDYLVVGALTSQNTLDLAILNQFIKTAPSAKFVFHMAFDLIPLNQQEEALDDLVNLGFKRILLNGSIDRHNVLDNLDHLRDLNTYANNKIELMVGGGVTLENYQEIVKKTGVAAVHGTKLTKLP